jgi:hypothetical protein
LLITKPAVGKRAWAKRNRTTGNERNKSVPVAKALRNGVCESMSEIEGITRLLGEAYDQWKGGEKEKETYKKAFFKEATKLLKQEAPAQIMELVHAPDEATARGLAERQFPRFTVLDVLPDGENQYRVALEERADLRPFTFVNPNDGRVYQRSVVEGSPLVDDERLQAEDPELWQRISFIPEPKPTLKPLEELSDEDLAAIRKYLYRGRPTVKLPQPRKATEEELDAHDD